MKTLNPWDPSVGKQTCMTSISSYTLVCGPPPHPHTQPKNNYLVLKLILYTSFTLENWYATHQTRYLARSRLNFSYLKVKANRALCVNLSALSGVLAQIQHFIIMTTFSWRWRFSWRGTVKLNIKVHSLQLQSNDKKPLLVMLFLENWKKCKPYFTKRKLRSQHFTFLNTLVTIFLNKHCLSYLERVPLLLDVGTKTHTA